MPKAFDYKRMTMFEIFLSPKIVCAQGHRFILC